MQTFQYTGRNRRGEAVKGRLEAAGIDAVATQLINTGITPIDIEVAKAEVDALAGFRSLQLQLREGRVTLQDQIFFCRQMYTLLKAGVPILQALRGLRDSTPKPALARMIAGIGEGLDAGLDLNTSLRRYPEVFSSLFFSMVQVGETTGNLPEAFLQLADYLEREKDTRDRIKQALRYPMFVMLAIVAAMFVINLVVIPAFAKVYASFRVELPWATQLLIALSNFTVKYWWLIVAAMAGGAYAARAWVRTPEGRYRWHQKKMRLPVVGKILYQSTLERFARAMAVSLRAGVPLVQGMTVVSRAVDNDFVGDRILQMRDGIERGETITRTAMATGLFPPLVLQMISVGEETGQVDTLLEEVAGYYQREVDYDLKNLSSAIEPILIVAVGVMVLILALGVFLPMWDLAKVVKGG